MQVRNISDLSHLRQAKFVFSFSVQAAAGGRGNGMGLVELSPTTMPQRR
jgi:hypothetical protein